MEVVYNEILATRFEEERVRNVAKKELKQLNHSAAIIQVSGVVDVSLTIFVCV